MLHKALEIVRATGVTMTFAIGLSGFMVGVFVALWQSGILDR